MGLRILPLLALLFVASIAGAQQPVVTAPPVPQIHTTGRGEVRAAPDRASILFAVETRAATAAAAGSENARRQRAVLDTLRRLGLTDDVLGTTGYQVTPEMSYGEGRAPRVIAYVARNTIRVEVRRVDMLGRYIDAALAAGANQISALQLYSSRDDELRREALAAAVTRAKADAEAMARAAGGTLGTLLELQSSFEFPRPIPVDAIRVASREADTPIVPGDQTVSAVVTGRWAFVPAR
jgi:uncharacterized protein